MRIFGLIIAATLFVFVLSDLLYVVGAWSEFRAQDVSHHIQFQLLSTLAICFYSWLSFRSWRCGSRTHLKLVLAFVLLTTLVVLYSFFQPLLWHIVSVEGIASYGLIFVGVLLLAGAVIVWWAWRVATAQPVVQAGLR
jgi:hypothetical protein